MKISLLALCLTVLATVALFTSCTKDISQQTQNAQANSAQTDNLLACSNCLVTHTEENIFGSVIDFFYNKKNNPDSLNFDGIPVALVIFGGNKFCLARVNL